MKFTTLSCCFDFSYNNYGSSRKYLFGEALVLGQQADCLWVGLQGLAGGVGGGMGGGVGWGGMLGTGENRGRGWSWGCENGLYILDVAIFNL